MKKVQLHFTLEAEVEAEAPPAGLQAPEEDFRQQLLELISEKMKRDVLNVSPKRKITIPTPFN